MHEQISFIGNFVIDTLCNSSYWYHTEASWKFISKTGHLDATWVRKLVYWQKTEKKIFFLDDRHYQIGFMDYCVHTICNTSYLYHTEASWSFISETGHLGATWGRKSEKSSFFLHDCYQMHYQICLWVNLFTLYVIHHIGIKQMPHDHLF